MSKEFENLKWYLQAEGQDKSDGYLVDFSKMTVEERDESFDLLKNAIQEDSQAISALARLDIERAIPILEAEAAIDLQSDLRKVILNGELWKATENPKYSKALSGLLKSKLESARRRSLTYIEECSCYSKDIAEALKARVLIEDKPPIRSRAAKILMALHQSVSKVVPAESQQKHLISLLNSVQSVEERGQGLLLLEKICPVYWT